MKNHVTWFNIKYIVQKAIAFLTKVLRSPTYKKLNNHIGAIWYFIHGYNAEVTRN
ncbi:hypothetical protein [Chroococcidiopsis sp. CCMEE 29]|uniref:hypothetical protein n=1 Tax=Chroococcidiopsis sp. CCMEE 29 TaxID=155894 RepID=UPI0020229555|nr:hypothetical protein [Chroococcidiopsis sp. CCMEE 29]